MTKFWNPWHGCIKCSEGCKNCYMYFLDSKRDKDGSEIYKVKTNFNYPLKKDRYGNYKIQSGEKINVCMTSDFFLKEADIWRDEIWDIIRKRSDVIFYILTKRPERIMDHLPFDWGDGYENVILNVTCENQKRAEERISILESIPSKHKGVMVAPFIGEVDILKYLEEGFIEEVFCGGENYSGARVCKYEWVKKLSNDCKKTNTNFCFFETGTRFVKDGKEYFIPNKETQSIQAYKSGLSFVGKNIEYKLFDENGNEVEKIVPFFRDKCNTCGSKMICSGCTNCGKCEK